MRIGVLAIQGSVIEHKRVLQKLGVEVIEVRLPEDLSGLDGIILPGGESTTQSKLLRRFKLFDELKKQIKSGLPVWGTCTGAILLAKKVIGKNAPETFKAMDIVANRNAYGGQIDSFEADLEIRKQDSGFSNFKGVFIRAPKLDVMSDKVEILCEHEDSPVMLRQKNMLATAFHPELTDDAQIHEYFINYIVIKNKN